MPGPAPLDAAVTVRPVSVSRGSNRISTQLDSTTTPGTLASNQAITDTHSATIVVPASGSLQVNLAGISFYFPSVTGLLGINARPINAGQTRSFITYAQGTGLRLGTSNFQKVELQNLDPANAVTVLIVVGGGIPNNTYDEFIDKRVIVTNQPGVNLVTQNATTNSVSLTTRDATWLNTLANGATRTVTDGYTTKGRKAFTVCNNDNAAVLSILDDQGNVIGTVQPTTAFYLEAGGTFKVNNASGAAVACNISEVYYT